MDTFTWARRHPNGTECSSKGHRAFSAFNARLPDGRTIEEHYQCDVKGYDIGGTNWRLGKGKPPKYPMAPEDQWQAYLALWRTWACNNPSMMSWLRQEASKGPKVLTDMFASSTINQARALAIILNETTPPYLG